MQKVYFTFLPDMVFLTIFSRDFFLVDWLAALFISFPFQLGLGVRV
jgi:hypothetical protein